jgi:rhodanese-related sulfurtransferase
MFATIMQGLRGGSDAADNIDHNELVQCLAGGKVTVVDVREASEFASGAIAGAINVPLSSFDPNKIPREKPVVVYCVSGSRSAMAQRVLRSAGFDEVRNYRAGIGIWRMQGGKMS